MNKEQIDAAYAKLCQELGHVTINVKKWSAREAELITAIDALDAQATRLKKEEEARAAMAAQQIPSVKLAEEPKNG